jgi:hypothetical protein
MVWCGAVRARVVRMVFAVLKVERVERKELGSAEGIKEGKVERNYPVQGAATSSFSGMILSTSVPNPHNERCVRAGIA